MNQYSTDLREAVVHALDTGASATEVARLFGVSVDSVARWSQRQRTTGSVAPLPRRGRPPKLDSAARLVVRQHVIDHPDATLDDHRALLAQRSITVSRATMSRTMAGLGITHKKRV